MQNEHGGNTLNEIDSAAYGYIFRTDCDTEDWSYVGQSTRVIVIGA